jgi:hypothetical protein
MICPRRFAPRAAMQRRASNSVVLQMKPEFPRVRVNGVLTWRRFYGSQAAEELHAR